MATDPNEHPAHRVPETFPLPPGDLLPSTETPALPAQPQLALSGPDYVGEVQDEGGDPVGQPPPDVNCDVSIHRKPALHGLFGVQSRRWRAITSSAGKQSRFTAQSFRTTPSAASFSA